MKEEFGMRDVIMIWSFTAFMLVFVAGEILFAFGFVEMTNPVVWIWRATALPSAAGVIVTTITPIWNWTIRMCEKAAKWCKK